MDVPSVNQVLQLTIVPDAGDGGMGRDEAAWGLSLWSLPQSSRNPNFASPNGQARFRPLLG